MQGTSKSIEEVLAEIDEALSQESESFLATPTPRIAAVATQHGISPPVRPRVFVPDPTPLCQLPPYFTKTQLRKNRSWTRLEIEIYLGEPDRIHTTLSYHRAHLYEAVRVWEIEQSYRWRNVPNRPPQVPLPAFDREILGGFYRVRDLFERGWYQEDIKTFLGAPHSYGRSYRGWVVKLYKRMTVHRIEETEGWQNRPSAVAPVLYQQGLPLSRIQAVLSLSVSESYNYTKTIRKAIREGKTARRDIKSDRQKTTRQKTTRREAGTQRKRKTNGD